MEVEFTEAAEHSWVLLAVMAIFMAIPIQYYGQYWLCALTLLATLALAAKLQSMVVHLAAIAYFDFNAEIKAYQEQQKKGFRAGGGEGVAEEGVPRMCVGGRGEQKKGSAHVHKRGGAEEGSTHVREGGGSRA